MKPGTGAGPAAVGVYISADVPPQLGEGVEGVAAVDVRVVARSWDKGRGQKGWVGWRTLGTYPRLGHASGWPTALELQPPPAAAAAAAAENDGDAAAAAAGAGVAGGGGGGAAQGGGALRVGVDGAADLARWSKWLHQGKITGSIRFF